MSRPTKPPTRRNSLEEASQSTPQAVVEDLLVVLQAFVAEFGFPVFGEARVAILVAAVLGTSCFEVVVPEALVVPTSCAVSASGPEAGPTRC